MAIAQVKENLHNSSENELKPCIYVLALGGTIGCISNILNDEFYERPSIDIQTIISNLDFDFTDLNIVSEQLFQKISHEMTHEDLLIVAKKINQLVKSDNIKGVVVTLGTNGLEETAYFINLIVNTKKPIVFTGAFRPYGSLDYDGDNNLSNAIILASHQKACGLGVVVTFKDSIVSARDAYKLNPSVIGDFTINGLGVLGSIQGKEINICDTPTRKHTFLSEFKIEDMTDFAKIYIIYGHIGADDILVTAAMENDAKGIISAGLGKGYQPHKINEALFEASKNGVIVVRCSRTGLGMINRDSKVDDKEGFIAGDSLSPSKARMLLAVALTKTQDKNEIQRIFDEY